MSTFITQVPVSSVIKGIREQRLCTHVPYIGRTEMARLWQSTSKRRPQNYFFSNSSTPSNFKKFSLYVLVLIERSTCVIKIVLNSHDSSLLPFDFAQVLKERGRHIYKYLWWFCSPFLEDACLFSSFKLLTSRLATLARKDVFWHGRPWCTTTNESIKKNVSARKNRNQLKYAYLTKKIASYLIRPILLTKLRYRGHPISWFFLGLCEFIPYHARGEKVEQTVSCEWEKLSDIRHAKRCGKYQTSLTLRMFKGLARRISHQSSCARKRKQASKPSCEALC